jgi:hypothetical protein
MASALRSVSVLVLVLPALAASAGASVPGQQREAALVQTWGRTLDRTQAGTKAADTPVTRVVNLLKEMLATLQKEMDEDGALHKELICWCNSNKWENSNAIAELEKKIAHLNAEIERLTALVAELDEVIKELKERIETLKKELAEAAALREKERAAFIEAEGENIKATENLRAAIMVLQKHFNDQTTLPDLKTEKDSWETMLLEVGRKDSPMAQLDRSLDMFMARNGMPTSDRTEKFLQADSVAQAPKHSGVSMSDVDAAVVRRALKSASAFMQAKHGATYVPAYKAQSHEILGILKQILEEMAAGLAEAQAEEAAKAKAYAELREAKTAELKAAETQLDAKEDELAQAQMDLANDKEDLERSQAALDELMKIMKALTETCDEAEANWQKRKQARLDEMKAVSETITILTEDEARDAMSSTYASLVQLTARSHRSQDRRVRAAALLRAAAREVNRPELSVLATTVELDAFTKVKKAIDDMITMLKKQQEDEVKHKDWCTEELHQTNMTAMETEDLKLDLEAKIEELSQTIKRLEDEIEAAKTQIAELEGALQRANEDRQKANLDFQKTIADQRAVQEVLAKALDRLATFYDKEGFLQKGKKGINEPLPTPPPVMEYKPNKGASGVMQMIEKLIYEAKDLEADSLKGEQEAQAAYEALVADTNSSVKDLQALVVSNMQAVAEAKKDLASTEEDLIAAVKELERLAKYNADLHLSCDFVLKNFLLRQDARAKEIEALQQAKQILSGADFN